VDHIQVDGTVEITVSANANTKLYNASLYWAANGT
jgi:hypothetical protein